MSSKATEATHNINNAFGPRTANEHSVQWWFKKFWWDESLEDEEHSDCPWKADSDQLRAIIEVDPLTTTEEVVKELNINHYMVTWHLKKMEKLKKIDKWMIHAAAAAA